MGQSLTNHDWCHSTSNRVAGSYGAILLMVPSPWSQEKHQHFIMVAVNFHGEDEFFDSVMSEHYGVSGRTRLTMAGISLTP